MPLPAPCPTPAPTRLAIVAVLGLLSLGALAQQSDPQPPPTPLPGAPVHDTAPRTLRAGRIATDITSLWRPEVDPAVNRGLRWLAAQQNANGFWYGVVGSRGRGDYFEIVPLATQTREGTGHLGVTALAGMAFLAGGHVPGRGEYGALVQSTVDAVLGTVQENGMISSAGTRMYSHAFATLFLAEVYGMGEIRPSASGMQLKTGLERAVRIIVDCQNAYGGWKYNAFDPDVDLSVTVCQLQALRAARNIGIEVSKTTIDRAVAYVKSCQIPSGRAVGRYYYSVHGRRAFRKSDSYSIQAAAATSLLSAGIYDGALLDPVVDFLDRESGEIMDRYPNHYYYWYGNYYACQVFFHADGALRPGCFARYYNETRDHLLATQQDDGRWRNPTNEGPGDVFGTAVACILLQVPRQYLPIFQR